MKLVLHHGDCVSVLKSYDDGSIGAVVSDPPYGLRFMCKAFDDLGDGAAQREWHVAWLTEAYRTLRPGGVIKAFSGSRTFHHLGAAMSEVGFTEVGLEAWSYGSGFPKSLNVSVAIDKAAGAERLVIGTKRGTGSDPSTGRRDMPGKAVGVKQVAVDVPITAPATPEAQRWEGWGTALKPAWEPVVVGRKPE